MAVETPTRLLYQTEVRRGLYIRRCLRMLLGGVASLGAGIALHEAGNRALAAPILIDIGLLAAILLGVWFSIRFIVNLVRSITRRSLIVRVYNKGLLWQQGDRISYRWGQVMRFREGARGLYVFNQPIVQWGAHTLTMDDRRALKFKPRYGDARLFVRAVRPYAARATASRMMNTLNEDKPVRLHPRLVVYPGGVAAAKTEIHWSELNAQVKGNRLVIRRVLPGKGARAIRRYPLYRVDNVGGFMEIVAGQSPQNQPDRYREPVEPTRAVRV